MRQAMNFIKGLYQGGSCQFTDVLIDSGGVLFGILIILLFIRLFGRKAGEKAGEI
ncbi:hypothetical protein [uncultured Merdimonas sp.]|uniref:hypothetical protein n=1 Tax=uncultured Merdimonas sp. TaxID=2023269 RepID=UPI003208A491